MKYMKNVRFPSLSRHLAVYLPSFSLLKNENDHFSGTILQALIGYLEGEAQNVFEAGEWSKTHNLSMLNSPSYKDDSNKLINEYLFKKAMKDQNNQ